MKQWGKKILAGVEGDECELLLNLEDPSLVPVAAQMETKGAGVAACGGGGCTF